MGSQQRSAPGPCYGPGCDHISHGPAPQPPPDPWPPIRPTNPSPPINVPPPLPRLTLGEAIARGWQSRAGGRLLEPRPAEFLPTFPVGRP